MKKHLPLSLPIAAVVLTVAGHAGTIDSSAFNAVTDGAVSTAGTLTFDVDVTGDSKLFLRVQDADPSP